MRQLREGGAQLRIPEPDGRIKSPTGEQASIRSKGQTEGALGLPSCPELGSETSSAVRCLPQAFSVYWCVDALHADPRMSGVRGARHEPFSHPANFIPL